MKKIILFPLISAFIWGGIALASSTSHPLPGSLGKVILVGVVEKDYDVSLAEEAIKRAGYTVEFKVAPWARCLEDIKQGRADVLANVFETAERKEVMYYGSEPILKIKQYLYTAKNSNIKFDGNLNQLKDYTIGTRTGFSYGVEFDNAKKNGLFKTKNIATMEQNIEKLKAKRIDMFIESPMNLISEFGKDSPTLKLIKFLRPPISNQSSFIVTSKKSKFGEKLINDLDKALKEIKKDGTYTKILTQFFGKAELE